MYEFEWQANEELAPFNELLEDSRQKSIDLSWERMKIDGQIHAEQMNRRHLWREKEAIFRFYQGKVLQEMAIRGIEDFDALNKELLEEVAAREELDPLFDYSEPKRRTFLQWIRDKFGTRV